MVGTVARVACLVAGLSWWALWKGRGQGPWPRPAALFGGVFCATTLFFAAQTLAIYHPAITASWAALAAASVIIIVAVFRRLGSGLRRAAGIAYLAVVNVSLTLAGVEILLRVAAVVWPSPLWAGPDDPGAAKILDVQYMAPGTMYFGTPINSWGDHDVEPRPRGKGECLVVCVGDSFSLGTVPLDHHYTTVAERSLENCPIYNMGVSSIGPREYLHLLRTRVPTLDPSFIVVALYVGNDISDVFATAAKEPSGAPPSVWDRESLRTFLVGRRLHYLAEERRALGADRRIGAPQGVESSGAASMPWLDDYHLERPDESPEAFMRIQEGIAHTTLSVDSWMYEKFFEYLAEIVDTVGVDRLGILLIPTEMQVEDQLFEEVERTHPDYRLDRDQPQKRITAWLNDRGVPYLDLLPVFREVPFEPDGSRHLYHLRDTHFNAHGYRLAGEQLGAFLREHLPR